MWIDPNDLTWRGLICSLLLVLAVLGVLVVFGDAPKPICPSGSVATHVRSQWLCTVKPL